MLIKKSPEAIAKWKQTVCLEIKKEAKNIGATIYFEDEAGIRFDFHSGKTWAPVSKTPVIEATGARFGLNMIAAISTLGHMRFMVVKDSVDSERICEFLNRLMHNADNPIFLVGYFNRRVYSIHKNATCMRIHKNTAARNIPIPMEMIFKTIFRDLPLAASFGWKSANRIRQTALALGKTGVDWVLGGRLPAPVLLRRTFERLGATYIKIGQLIASSPSIFPEDYVKEFQRCLDQTEPVAFKHMEKVLKNELGPRYIPDIFSHVAQTPLASASIAQVYAARLASGEDVVIKIQRPSVETILATDLNALYFAAVVLERLVPRLKHASLAGILSEIRRTVLEECNFIKEAENIEIFSRFLEHAGNPDVVTPKVYHQASSRRVLTLERLYGTPLTRRQDLLQSTRNPYRILGAAFEIWMESITECELFHADLHAGNILILDDGRVGFIDFGIVGRISEKTQTGVQSLIKSMLSMDYKTMAESMLAIGMTRKKVNIEDLAKDLEDFYVSMESPMSDEDMSSDVTNISGPNPSRPDQTEPDRALLEIVRIAETHGIRFPREFTLLLKQFLYFDSYRDILFDMTGDDMEGLMDDFMQKMEGFGPMPTR